VQWTNGPMARNVADLTFEAKVLHTTCYDMRDTGTMMRERILPIPWREVKLPEKLKIGYFIEADVFKTSPACARAVMESVDALTKAGHRVEPFEPPSILEIFKAFVALGSAEGYKSRITSIGPDPLEPSMKLVALGSKVPRWLHYLIEQGVEHIVGDKVWADVFRVSGKKSTHAYWQWTGRRDNYNIQFFKAAWEDGGYDMLLCPVMAVPALEHGRTKDLSPLCILTVLFSMVESTVGTLPITRVDKTRDALPPDFLANSKGSKILEAKTYGGPDPAYDAVKMHGLPVGVQVVGKPWEEEKVLAMMAVLEGLVGYK